MNFLIIDDDPDTHEVISSYLKSEGFSIHSAYSGLTGIEMARQRHPDLVILDVRLPQVDGWEVCQKIRTFSGVPILMISAVAQQDEDIVYGLSIGADDYVVKPIRPKVLKARIQALLRRSINMGWRTDRQGYIDQYLMVDLQRQQLFVDGQRVRLSSLEYLLLELLIRNAGYPVPMEEIIEELWSERANDTFAKYVRIYVKRLRDIIEPDPDTPRYILTEYGFGYWFEPQI